MTAREYLRAWKERFTEAGVDSPGLSAELLLAHALGLERNDLLKRLILEGDLPLDSNALDEAHSLALRRQAGEPAAYLLGEKEFYGRPFLVNPATLIPRPETELLVDQALALAASMPAPDDAAPRRFADLGTGSGCIAVSFALEMPGWHGLALDISRPALETAAANARRLGAGGLVFALGDLACPPLAPASLDLLLSNPPYVGADEHSSLSHEVRDYEPVCALVPPGGTGLEQIRILHDVGLVLLRPGGTMLVEMGCSQKDVALSLFSGQGWGAAVVLDDLAGLPRLLRVVKG